MGSFRGLSDLLAWLQAAPAGTNIPAASMAQLLEPLVDSAPSENLPAPRDTWRERLWTAPGDVRLGVAELSEAMARPKSWVYRHTAEKSDYPPIPHRKLDGALSFRVGDVRDWINANEITLVGPPPVPLRGRRRPAA